MKELLRYHRKGPKAEPVAMVCSPSLSAHTSTHVLCLSVHLFVFLAGRWSLNRVSPVASRYLGRLALAVLPTQS